MKKLFMLIGLLSIYCEANTLSPQTYQAVDEKLSKFRQDTLLGKYHSSVEIMPSSFFKFIADKSNVNPSEIKRMLIEKANHLSQGVKIHNYQYYLNNSTENKINDLNYVFVPTSLEMSIGSKDITVKSYLLGVKENQNWYFLNWQDKYISIIKQIYPELKNIESPK
ncbi:Uncharacterised protein [Canicola haemoglobinophilus]|uniref:Uncharacterized protein n=1 Tax=Canicola haemoglobinophilus TaxID=733 RepID=A0AB38H9I0_9PAST|nr:hypothetical protein [Canicola haemoglobinophilus]STO54090.1 Uncharacterised protein [Canicola haemoglobinophilus]STO68623.1 Uncharacterised protein [Canicola haemoglobinophilus]